MHRYILSTHHTPPPLNFKGDYLICIKGEPIASAVRRLLHSHGVVQLTLLSLDWPVIGLHYWCVSRRSQPVTVERDTFPGNGNGNGNANPAATMRQLFVYLGTPGLSDHIFIIVYNLGFK